MSGKKRKRSTEDDKEYLLVDDTIDKDDKILFSKVIYFFNLFLHLLKRLLIVRVNLTQILYMF